MSYFEAAMLPEASKLALCQDLLAQFGASVQRVNERSGEMIHGCLVSPGVHSNQDNSPTASLNYKKLTYNCLGCGSSGGLLWFIATCRDETSVDARRWLERVAGLGGQVLELDAMIKFLDAIYARPTATPIPTYSDKMLKPWSFNHPYLLEDRGISEDTYRRFRLGWDPKTDRVVLPHFWQGNLVGWQTRKLPFEWRSVEIEDDSPLIHSGMANSPKYHSSPDFPKDSTIFNHVPSERTVVVESMMSVLRHEGPMHWEATFGAQVPDLQLRRLVKHDQVVLWMDNDKAGWNAVLGHPEVKPTKEKPQGEEAVPGMAEVLAQYTKVKVVDSPWQQDAGDLPSDAAKELVDAAVPWSAWRPPEVLYCFTCEKRAHSGPCNL
jgi:hypothetical protein